MPAAKRPHVRVVARVVLGHEGAEPGVVAFVRRPSTAGARAARVAPPTISARRRRMKSSWIGIGFSHHRVPSLSNTATRSSTGTAADPPSPDARSTKSMMACLVGPSPIGEADRRSSVHSSPSRRSTDARTHRAKHPRSRPQPSSPRTDDGQRTVGRDAVERHSRFVMLVGLPEAHRADVVAAALAAKITGLPQHLRRSLTWVQGREMAQHGVFTVANDVPVYFCDPRSPGQSGSNENTRYANTSTAPGWATPAQRSRDEDETDALDKPSPGRHHHSTRPSECVDPLAPPFLLHP